MYIGKRREWIKKALISMYIEKYKREWLAKKKMTYYVYSEKKGMCKKGDDYYDAVQKLNDLF